LNQTLSDKAHAFSVSFLQDFVEKSKGKAFHLFDMAQKLNAALQLELTYHYKLRTFSI
jgi:hypothetical protein